MTADSATAAAPLRALTTTVVGVDIAVCAIPMPQPVRLGATVYHEREYVALRIRTDDGLVGNALGHSRNVPIAPALERLAPALIARDALRRAEIVGSLRAANVNGRASLVRALSLVDIALWDVMAQRARLPLWRLLGGARERVPLLAVAGYSGDVKDELRRLADAGFRCLKLHVEPAAVSGLKPLQRAAGVPLAVDFHMAFASLPEALAVCRPLDELGLAFIEDPFPPERWRLTAELAARLRTPVAAGEDALGLEALRDLMEAVAILRVDATASGGIATALDAVALAAVSGRGVITHAFHDLHGDVGGGLAAVDLVETIPEESGANPVGRLLSRRHLVEGGELVLGEEPGHGLVLDWEAVVTHARDVRTIEDGAQ
jgi:L-alanine-DL-glutamate epimerase-like enolase superfamily enzyme